MGRGFTLFNVLLRSPEMGDLTQQSALPCVSKPRFRSRRWKRSSSSPLVFWIAQFEWSGHRRAALQAGVSPAAVDAIANGQRPALFKTRHMSGPVFPAAKNRFAKKGVVDIVGLCAWYSTVSMALTVDRHPVAQAELKPLVNPLP